MQRQQQNLSINSFKPGVHLELFCFHRENSLKINKSNPDSLKSESGLAQMITMGVSPFVIYGLNCLNRIMFGIVNDLTTKR